MFFSITKSDRTISGPWPVLSAQLRAGLHRFFSSGRRSIEVSYWALPGLHAPSTFLRFVADQRCCYASLTGWVNGHVSGYSQPLIILWSTVQVRVALPFSSIGTRTCSDASPFFLSKSIKLWTFILLNCYIPYRFIRWGVYGCV